MPDVVDESDRPILEIDDLVTHFDSIGGLVKAVDGVSLSVRKGTTLGIVGESGSGKTVLTRSIMGILPRNGVHRSGHVRLDGRDLTKLKQKELREIWGAQIGLVFQDPMTSLHPVRKIGVQVMAPLRRHRGLRRQDARRAALELLRSVGMPNPDRIMGVYPHELSGGMRQRVMIAIAMSCGPQLLLADEPTTALDVTVQKQILELLAHQQSERSMAIMLVTHDLGVVASYSDEVAVMYAGRIVERAPTKALFSDVKMPYTEALFRSIPRLADPSHTELQVVPGRPPDLSHLPAGCSFAARCPYVRDRCRLERPNLLPALSNSDHLVACWYPIGAPARPGSEVVGSNEPLPSDSGDRLAAPR